MQSLMVLKLDDGDRTFPTKELDFYNLVCELEDAGVDVMSLTEGSIGETKIFSTFRAMLAVLINVDKASAGKYLSQHIKNGGSLDIIMDTFSKAMESAGFGAPETEAPAKKTTRGRKPKGE